MARDLIIYIALHCVRRSSWTVTTLATLVFSYVLRMIYVVSTYVKKTEDVVLLPLLSFSSHFSISFLIYWSCCGPMNEWKLIALAVLQLQTKLRGLKWAAEEINPKIRECLEVNTKLFLIWYMLIFLTKYVPSTSFTCLIGEKLVKILHKKW